MTIKLKLEQESSERRYDMITTTMMTTVIRRDYHNDVKQVALDFGKDQSRIFLYAYMIRKKSHDDMLI